jgi:hypothetical protein
MPWRRGVVVIVNANRTEDRQIHYTFAMLFCVTQFALLLCIFE